MLGSLDPGLLSCFKQSDPNSFIFFYQGVPAMLPPLRVSPRLPITKMTILQVGKPCIYR